MRVMRASAAACVALELGVIGVLGATAAGAGAAAPVRAGVTAARVPRLVVFEEFTRPT
jgi:hypothetical protein